MADTQETQRRRGRPCRGQRERGERANLRENRERLRRIRANVQLNIAPQQSVYSSAMINAARTFDRKVWELEEKTCIYCNRASFVLSMVGEDKCNVCAKESTSTKFTASNNMDPGPIPPELEELSYIEQMVIAQIHPVVSLFKLGGAQYAHRGNVINFRQDISSSTTLLPHHPSTIPSTIIFNRQTPHGLAQFTASASKIRRALLWLKSNNDYYRMITISEENLAAIGENNDLSQELLNLDLPDDQAAANQAQEVEEIQESFIPQLWNIDQQNQIQEALNVPYPSIDGNPINEFSEEGYIVKAFPTLFPTGKADFLAHRDVALTLDQYFKYLLMYKDKRFARDPRFRFFAMNTVMRRAALSTANVFIRRNALENLNVADLSLRLQQDPGFINQLMVYSASQRSTRAYWRQRCSELLKMIDQIGLPDVFLTLSAADYHQPDLFEILAPDVADVNTLSDRQRRNLMHENPMIVAHFFYERCSLFIQHVLKPIYRVKDSWYRFEWQWRGSPHLHGLIWLENSPKTNEEAPSPEELELIRTYLTNSAQVSIHYTLMK
ncbi:uncharacterized protein LOC141851459 [Brevipalpus obovatus]|uniref:uncharacterized protein LOC141851459 n=1 Tax=Brevipalpus obovatus TaxID=246614 RepID=UPI003D9F16DC